MFSEEEVELKDQIIQYLENCGFLTKVKAEIRAGVYLALEEDGVFKSRNPLSNKKLEDFIRTDEGRIVCSLVREFLDYFELKYTLSVFDPEVTSSATLATRNDLCDKLNLSNTEAEGPILASLIRKKKYFSSTEKNFDTKCLTSNKVVDVKNRSLENQEVINDAKVDDLNNDIISASAVPKNLVNDDEDNDSFFDDPLPKEKSIFFSDSKKTDNFVSNLYTDNNQFNNKEENIFNKDSLTSLKNLPSLTGVSSHSTDWTSNKVSKNFMSSSEKTSSSDNNMVTDERNIDYISKTNSEKDESVDDTSEKIIISEESIEEEIEEDLSAGIDDILNSSLSLADDVTTDQTVSQVSVGGVDHIEHIDALT